MNLLPTAQATLLLTSYFSHISSEEAKPLTNSEWGRFALWLKEKKATPADLLISDPKSLLSGWYDNKISTERIIALLNRGHSLALAMEKWQRAGLWIVTRSDPDYPHRLKAKLKTDSPPVLFGCGNKSLLNMGGIAVVGSRNVAHADLTFTEQLSAKAASQNIVIVSGGARGTDETAMLGAIRAGGNVIGVMSDNLLTATTSSKWRSGIMNGHVVLISPFYPEAGFSTGNAMARNKYIYCMADASVVIHSSTKGGTISGAEENLKRGWVPLWVKPTHDQSTTNELLVSKGGKWCPETLEQFDLTRLFITDECHSANGTQSDLFSQGDKQPDLFSATVAFSAKPLSQSPKEAFSENTNAAELIDTKAPRKNEMPEKPINFYQLFINELKRLTDEPKRIEELIEITQLHKSQITCWLKQAIEEGYIKKLNRPVRYQWNHTSL
ncbi:DNA-processing protein DprA [Xenorhabdus griffiniae]|nr:DNA-processing protein DprA [Xenorhabdus griffiniae]MBD1228143.1 DNA-protecting protein DprA [Xenorhabdus griffiniae]MBE8588848.1 DNA-protecting protein DprA [Xenorhabdus griffiniae]